MDMKEIYKRLELTSTYKGEEKKFIIRIKILVNEILEPLVKAFYSPIDNFTKSFCFKIGKEINIVSSFDDINLQTTFLYCEALIETIKESEDFNITIINIFIEKIKEAFELSIIDLGYSFENGLFYKKGAKELDETLIIESYEWLFKYPDIRKSFKETLQDYYKKDYLDAITKAYSTIESLVKTILNNNKSLGNNTENLLTYLNLGKDWKSILKNFCTFAHEYSLRHGKKESKQKEINVNELEAYLYMTGLLIRLIIKNKK